MINPNCDNCSGSGTSFGKRCSCADEASANTNYIFCSGAVDAIPMERSDRRFWAVDAGAPPACPSVLSPKLEILMSGLACMRSNDTRKALLDHIQMLVDQVRNAAAGRIAELEALLDDLVAVVGASVKAANQPSADLCGALPFYFTAPQAEILRDGLRLVQHNPRRHEDIATAARIALYLEQANQQRSTANGAVDSTT